MHLITLANRAPARVLKVWPVVMALLRLAYDGGTYNADTGPQHLGNGCPLGTSSAATDGAPRRMFKNGKADQAYGSVNGHVIDRLWANMNHPAIVAAALDECGYVYTIHVRRAR